MPLTSIEAEVDSIEDLVKLLAKNQQELDSSQAAELSDAYEQIDSLQGELACSKADNKKLVDKLVKLAADNKQLKAQEEAVREQLQSVVRGQSDRLKSPPSRPGSLSVVAARSPNATPMSSASSATPASGSAFDALPRRLSESFEISAIRRAAAAQKAAAQKAATQKAADLQAAEEAAAVKAAAEKAAAQKVVNLQAAEEAVAAAQAAAAKAAEEKARAEQARAAAEKAAADADRAAEDAQRAAEERGAAEAAYAKMAATEAAAVDSESLVAAPSAEMIDCSSARDDWDEKRALPHEATAAVVEAEKIREEVPPSASPPLALSRPSTNSLARPEDAQGFAAFLSHFKVEAATEARWLQQELEGLLGRRCFLDSDDLSDLSRLQDHVRESGCVLLLQTRDVLTRPWCIVELLTAIDSGVPIVGVSIISGQAQYDFARAGEYMSHLDTLLEEEKRAQLGALGVDMVDAAFKLANTLPNIISLPLNMNESRTILSARVSEIVSAMGKAARPALTAERDAWLAARGTAPQRPPHGRSARAATEAWASLPAEVPTLPENAVGRAELLGAIKAHVLRKPEATAEAAAATPVAAKQSNLTSACGMGGAGKTMLAASLARDDDVRAAFEKICFVSVSHEPDTASLQQALFVQLAKRPLPEAARSDERLALEELKDAAKDVSVLLILDDVWIASHATPLNFVDRSARHSAVFVTTRIRSLLDGAAEVPCGVLTAEASLELLLRAGGCEALLVAPPPAAREAVELCGRLPLGARCF